MIDLPFDFDPLQGPAVVLGMIGALFVPATSPNWRRAGFAAWMVGNLLWIGYGVLTENVYMVAMFGFYWIFAVIGFVNNSPSFMCNRFNSLTKRLMFCGETKRQFEK